MGKINDGHHEYIGSHVDKMEERLQSAFPGQSEDFYKYGKWGEELRVLMHLKI